MAESSPLWFGLFTTAFFLAVTGGYLVGKIRHMQSDQQTVLTNTLEESAFHGIGYATVAVLSDSSTKESEADSIDGFGLAILIPTIAAVVFALVLLQIVLGDPFSINDRPLELQLAIVLLLSCLVAYELGAVRQSLGSVIDDIHCNLKTPICSRRRFFWVGMVYVSLAVLFLAAAVSNAGGLDLEFRVWGVGLLIFSIPFGLEFLATWCISKESSTCESGKKDVEDEETEDAEAENNDDGMGDSTQSLDESDGDDTQT